MKQDDFTLEDILEEQRQQRERNLPAGVEYVEVPPEELEDTLGYDPAYYEQEEPALAQAEYEEEYPPQEYPAQEYAQEPQYEEYPPEEPQYGGAQFEAPQHEAPPHGEPQYEEPQYEAQVPQEPEEALEEELPEKPGKKKKKKKRKGLFGWRKKVPDFDENEDDMYYGIQLKPIDEYRLDGDAPPLGEEGYKALFDDSKAIDGEVEENFQRLQQERRRRVAEAVQSAGMNEEQIADEFGVAAPAPVTSFAADPYAQQHGLAPEGRTQEGLSELQRAMLEGSQTMELKLNVLNSTIELQKVDDQPEPMPVTGAVAPRPITGQQIEAPQAGAQPSGQPVNDRPVADWPATDQPVSEQVIDEILASAVREQPRPVNQSPVNRPVNRPEYTYREEVPQQQPPQPVQPQPMAQRPAPQPENRPPEYVYTEEPQQPVRAYEEVPQQRAPRQQAQPEDRPPENRPPEYVYTEEPQQPVRTYEEVPQQRAPRQQAQPEDRPPEYVYTEEPQQPMRAYEEVPRQQTQPEYVYSEETQQEKTREISREEMAAMRTARPEVREPQGTNRPEQKPAEPPRPVQEVPYVDSIFEYRSRNIPTHIINADALQSALLSESENLQRVKDLAEGKPVPRRRPRKKPEDDLPPEPPASENTGESIDDYTGPEDARSISNDLRGEMQALSMRVMITGVCTVLLALVSLICRSRFSPKGSGSWPLAYVILTLVFFGVAVVVCGKPILGGLKALFAANANSDSGVSIAAAAALVQTVSGIFFRDQLAEGGLHLYALVVSVLLFLNSIGKLTMIRRIHSNFRFLTSREQKYAVRLFDDYNTSLKMTKDCVAEKPLIAYQAKAGFLKRFLELSYTPDPSEAASHVIAPLGLLASLVLCIVCLVIHKDVPSAIAALTAACCASVAAANMLSVNLPVSNMCKTIRRAGAMTVGYEAVNRLGDVNAVIADAGELFPTGTVTLNGIKTFGGRAFAEDAVMAASALMREVGGPLTGVFDQVISENEGVLPLVERFSYESGAGVVGRVDGKTIYVGNRGLLINHRLEAPSREEETQYASGNKNIVYIAVDAQVAAMLVLSYAADRRRKNELQRLEDSGISVLVRTTDPNVTVALMSRLFGVDTGNVGILDGQLGETAQQLMEEAIPRADAVAATKGRMESLMSVVAACVEQKRTVGVLVAIQTMGAILGFVLVGAMSCFNGVKQLSALVLCLYQLALVAVLILLPRFRK